MISSSFRIVSATLVTKEWAAGNFMTTSYALISVVRLTVNNILWLRLIRDVWQRNELYSRSFPHDILQKFYCKLLKSVPKNGNYMPKYIHYSIWPSACWDKSTRFDWLDDMLETLFFRAQHARARRSYRRRVRLSVCPSRARIDSKLMTVGSRGVHHRLVKD